MREVQAKYIPAAGPQTVFDEIIDGELATLQKEDLIVGDVILVGSRNGGVVSLSASRQKELTKLIRGFGEFLRE